MYLIKIKEKFGCFYFQHSYYLDTKNERMVNAYFQSDRFRIPAVIRKKYYRFSIPSREKPKRWL